MLISKKSFININVINMLIMSQFLDQSLMICSRSRNTSDPSLTGFLMKFTMTSLTRSPGRPAP